MANSKLSGIGQAIAVVLLLCGLGLSLWNEYRTLRVSLMLKKAEKEFVEADASGAVDPSCEGKLVHLTGVTRSAEPLRDSETGVEVDALLLKREVCYYQLVEYRDSQTGEITYYEDWTDNPLSSEDYQGFRKDANFVYVRLSDRKDTCSTVSLGGYRLPARLIGWTRGYTDNLKIDVPEENLAGLRARVRNASKDGRSVPVNVFKNTVYVGGNPSQPRIGDVKIEYSIVPHGTVSVLGKAQGDEIVQYGEGREYHILNIMEGKHKASEIFDEERENNRGGGWLVRIAGLVLLFIGLLGSLDLIKSLFRR